MSLIKYQNRITQLSNIEKIIDFNCDKLIKYLSNFQFIGSGMTSTVYKLILQNYDVAIKKTPFDNPQEIEFMKKLKDLITNNICPHTQYYFTSLFCENNYFIIQEYIPNSTFDWLKTMHSDTEWFVHLFQITYFSYIFEKHFNILNDDMKWANINYLTVNKGGYIKYTIKNQIFYVPNIGIIFVVIDNGYTKPLTESTNNSISLSEIWLPHITCKIYNIIEEFTIDELMKIDSDVQSLIDRNKDKNDLKISKGIPLKSIEASIKRKIVYDLYRRKKLNVKPVKNTFKYPPSNVYNFVKEHNLKIQTFFETLNKFEMFKTPKDDIVMSFKDE